MPADSDFTAQPNPKHPVRADRVARAGTVEAKDNNPDNDEQAVVEVLEAEGEPVVEEEGESSSSATATPPKELDKGKGKEVTHQPVKRTVGARQAKAPLAKSQHKRRHYLTLKGLNIKAKAPTLYLACAAYWINTVEIQVHICQYVVYKAQTNPLKPDTDALDLGEIVNSLKRLRSLKKQELSIKFKIIVKGLYLLDLVVKLLIELDESYKNWRKNGKPMQDKAQKKLDLGNGLLNKEANKLNTTVEQHAAHKRGIIPVHRELYAAYPKTEAYNKFTKAIQDAQCWLPVARSGGITFVAIILVLSNYTPLK